MNNETQCTSILNRSEIFRLAHVIYTEVPRCVKDAGHTGLHDGGWNIGQWADAWSEGYNE